MSDPAVAGFRNPDADAIRAMLRQVKTIAVVGFSPKADRPSYRIARALRAFGYRVIAVGPASGKPLARRLTPGSPMSRNPSISSMSSAIPRERARWSTNALRLAFRGRGCRTAW
jgi:hypothetical protein